MPKKVVKKAVKKAAKKTTKKLDRVAYQIKVTLQHIRPPIWRRLVVPNDIRLNVLHSVIQVAMGWENCHLHQFQQGDVYFGEPDPQFSPMELRDESKVRLDELLTKKKDWIGYEYDFGDGWYHKVELEDSRPATAEEALPICLAGKRACPPEDVGGSGGYEELLQAIAAPDHPEGAELLEWVGEGFDPEHFDVDEVNRAFKRYLG